MKNLVKRLTALETEKEDETIVIQRTIVVPDKEWDNMTEADRDAMIEECRPLIIVNSVVAMDGQPNRRTK